MSIYERWRAFAFGMEIMHGHKTNVGVPVIWQSTMQPAAQTNRQKSFQEQWPVVQARRAPAGYLEPT